MPESDVERVGATYRIATRLDLNAAAAVLAGEQSAGTFTRVAFESDDLLARHAAVVEWVEPEGESAASDVLPGALGAPGDTVQVGRVRIGFPAENLGPSLAALMTTVAGNLFELRELAGVKLLDLDLPDSVVSRYSGPLHGIRGTREAVANPDQVMLGTIVKPSIGLPPPQLAEMVAQLAEARIDVIKDDEINSDAPYFPLHERIELVSDVIDAAEQKTGKPVMYAFNVTGDMDQMKHAVDRIARRGGTCAMVAVPQIGYTALSELRRHTDLVIHGHRAGFGAMDRHPLIGYSFTVFQKLARLAGADHLHVGGIDSKFWETNEQVVASIRDLQTEQAPGEPPVPAISSAQTAATAQTTHRMLGSSDLLILAGGGIHAHPGGIADGVESMREAWRIASAGEDVRRNAMPGSPLSVALDTFGGE